MTVESQISRASYQGNGSTASFPVPFYFLNADDLDVILVTDEPLTVTTLLLSRDYTITGVGNPQGGAVLTTIPPPSQSKLIILRNISLTQLTHYVPNDPFPAKSHERALDKLTMIAQQMSEVLSRTITLPVYSDVKPEDYLTALETMKQEAAQDFAVYC